MAPITRSVFRMFGQTRAALAEAGPALKKSIASLEHDDGA
jgi:hypothetical protein